MDELSVIEDRRGGLIDVQQDTRTKAVNICHKVYNS